MKHCSTCGQTDNRPYRNRVQGVVEEGCIDAFHNDAMRLDPWHNRPEAKTVRTRIAIARKVWQIPHTIEETLA